MARKDDGRRKGTVKWFNAQKGYGFITPNTGGKEIFVHFTAIEQPDGGYRSLNEGEPVEYSVEEKTRSGKPEAVEVVRLS